jgi:hypothetical protein
MAALRVVMESALLSAVGSRRGLLAIGPVFAGSQIMLGDADLIAGGLLVELKTTSKKPSLGVTDCGRCSDICSWTMSMSSLSPTWRCSPRGTAIWHSGISANFGQSQQEGL